MSTLPIPDLSPELAAVIARVEAGEPITLLRDGRPVVELRPVAQVVRSRRPHGLAAGTFVVPDDFDAPLSEDVFREFEGR
jgi:prevent-host-death family protein